MKKSYSHVCLLSEQPNLTLKNIFWKCVLNITFDIQTSLSHMKEAIKHQKISKVRHKRTGESLYL